MIIEPKCCKSRKIENALGRGLAALAIAPLVIGILCEQAWAAPATQAECVKKALSSDPCKKKRYRFSKTYCDGDNDWLSNGLEKSIGTDPKNRDTDGDGVLDGVELNLLHSNPLFPDQHAGCLPIPEPQPSPAPCDVDGGTTMFGIPAGMVGHIPAGEIDFTQNCSSCHPIINGVPKGSGREFTELKSVTSAAPMNLRLPDQTLANLVAFLNLSMSMCATPTPDPTVPTVPTATPSGPTPTPNPNASPTPTPTATLTPTSTPSPTATPNGQMLYAQYCTSCHGGQAGLGSVSLSALNSAIQNKPQMQYLSFLTSTERTLIVNYINSN